MLFRSYVGIGNIIPATQLHVGGNVSASSYTSSLNNAVGYFGTSSWAQSSSVAITASAATTITFIPSTASFATTASAATSITFIPVTSSYAVSASTAYFTSMPNIKIQADNHLFTGSGTTTVYTLSSSYDPSILNVSVDGLVHVLTEDYTVATNQLTFISAPPSSSNIVVKAFRLVLT